MSHNLLKAHRVETKATVAPVRQVASGNTPFAQEKSFTYSRLSYVCLVRSRNQAAERFSSATTADLS